GRVLPQVGHEVDLAAGNRGGALGGAEVQADADPVRVPGRLGRGVPFPEARVAYQEQFPAGQVPADQVRPGGRQRGLGLAAGSGRGQHVGEGQGQLVQEIRVRLVEVEGDGAGPVVGGDATGQVTGPGGPQARRGATDRAVVRHTGRAELEQALEGAGDVAGPDERAGRVPDARAQVKRIGAAVARRRWQRQREVWHQPGAVRPGGVVQRDQPVVDQAEEL